MVINDSPVTLSGDTGDSCQEQRVCEQAAGRMRALGITHEDRCFRLDTGTATVSV